LIQEQGRVLKELITNKEYKLKKKEQNKQEEAMIQEEK
jgi:hypothetical protein